MKLTKMRLKPMKLQNEINELDIKECLGDYYTDSKYRKAFYDEYGYNESALTDELPSIRLAGYRALGFTETAKLDESKAVRQEAYRTLGFTPDAYNDPDESVRFEAVMTLKDIQQARQIYSNNEKAMKMILDSFKGCVFAVKFKQGYYAKKQPYYEWSFTDNIADALFYKKASAVIERVFLYPKYHATVMCIDVIKNNEVIDSICINQ